jgi:uncharacterized 2Fe-2S/4Fe-4S cluster protein (DUF4445 family)
MPVFNNDFEPVGRRGVCASDQSLLESARQLNVDLVSICGGIGNCERCKVQVIAGQVTKPSLEEKPPSVKVNLSRDTVSPARLFP